MKKWFLSFILFIAMLFAPLSGVTAAAASSASLSLSAPNSVQRGSSVSVTVSVSDIECYTMMLAPTYDKNAFTLEGVSSSYVVTSGTKTVVESRIAGNGITGGALVTYNFSVASNAAFGDYSIDVAAFTALTDRSFEMEMTKAGTVLLDDIRLVESAMIINGSFNAGFAGYEWYVDATAGAVYVVDSLNEDNALDVTVKNTGDADWKVQIKQNGVELEKGKTYTLSFRAKSSMDRKVRVILQGLEPLGWPSYSGDGFFDLTSEYQNYSVTFTMEHESDANAFLSICYGMVDQIITTQHRICIDDISLCVVE